jgi:hypothetical protein
VRRHKKTSYADILLHKADRVWLENVRLGNEAARTRTSEKNSAEIGRHGLLDMERVGELRKGRKGGYVCVWGGR